MPKTEETVKKDQPCQQQQGWSYEQQKQNPIELAAERYWEPLAPYFFNFFS